MEATDDPVAMATVAPLAWVTTERPIGSELESSIRKPYLARAMVAPDTEHPDGTQEHNARGMSVIQQHASFFDLDNNGIVYPRETYGAFRALGFNVFISFFAAVIIHLLFSYPSLPGYIPSLFFPIYIVNVHNCKHGSDSGTFDTEGRYIPASFENIFSKYAKTMPDKLTFKEIWNMTQANYVTYDIMGWIIAKAEWSVLYLLAKDDEGYLSKEAIRSTYDGTLFHKIAKQNATKGKKTC